VNIQSELHEQARGPVITANFRLLRDLECWCPRIVRTVCHKAVTDVQRLAGDNIFNTGDDCSCMYFVDVGQLEYKWMRPAEVDSEGFSIPVVSSPLDSLEGALKQPRGLEEPLKQGEECIPLSTGYTLAEGALWTTWNNYGNLYASTDCVVLSIDSCDFFDAIPDQSVLLHTTQYARMYVKHLNESLQCERSDIMSITISRQSMQSLGDTIGNDKHLVFVSHYKLEAGTEATLMQEALTRMLEDVSTPNTSIFVDSENLSDLSMLKKHVANSYNLVLLLTPGVLRRPWCLIEIVTAAENGVTMVPIEVQRPGSKFHYPDETFYKNLRSGKYLSHGATKLLAEEGIVLPQVEFAIQQAFMKISLPFSPHKTANVRHAELTDIMDRCLQGAPMGQTMTMRVPTTKVPSGKKFGLQKSESGAF